MILLVMPSLVLKSHKLRLCPLPSHHAIDWQFWQRSFHNVAFAPYIPPMSFHLTGQQPWMPCSSTDCPQAAPLHVADFFYDDMWLLSSAHCYVRWKIALHFAVHYAL